MEKTMQIKIDGIARTVAGPTKERAGWIHFQVIGTDINGRTCPVAEHSVPSHWWEHPEGAVTTGGHTYSA